MPVTNEPPGRGGKRSSFQRRNKLLNKHGKAYRKQDLKPGSKRKAPPATSSTSPNTQTEAPQPADTQPQDSYTELLMSLKKKPTFYYKQLLAQLEEADSSSDEPSKDSENEDMRSAQREENSSEAETFDLEEPLIEDILLGDCNVTVEEGYFSANFGSNSKPQSETDHKYQSVPNTLYDIRQTPNVESTNIEPKTLEDLMKLDVEPDLARQWSNTTKQVQSKGVMKPVSATLFPIFQRGSDVLFGDSTFENQSEILRLLALHSLNHVKKTRKLVLKNNSKLSKAANEEKEIDSDDLRDQGFTRPKVLLLFPFRNVVHKFVHQFIKLALPNEKKQVSNRKRFDEEYGSDGDEKPNLSKSRSYQKLFLGNNDDFFTLGIGLAKNSVKLYTDFYNSDVIVASPLGLRNVIGAEGDKERDYDFLSSIELCCVMLCDVYLMQNWEHLLHTFQHLNMSPTQDHDTDFSRVKMWVLDGFGRRFRQNIIMTSLLSPEINSLFSKECNNHRGAVRITVAQGGALSSVLYPVRQVFTRMKDKREDQTHVDYMTNTRFDYFVYNTLPQYRSADVMSILIVIPSYFDFVRVRNYFKKESWNFAQLSEYSTNTSITNTRRNFAEGNIKYLLTTERFFFFKRYKLKNVQHLVFYEAPLNSECYVHYVNMMDGEGATSTLIYNKFDGTKLERILGTKQCQQVITSNLTTHMIISE